MVKGLKISKSMSKGLPFILFLTLLGMTYIANAHRAELKMRHIEIIEKQAEEKYWEYMSVQAEITHRSTQSEIVRNMTDEGLQPAVEPPRELRIKP